MLDRFPERNCLPDSCAHQGALALPPGLLAQDGSSVFGFDNYAFLTGGSNDLLGQYSQVDGLEGEDHVAQAWKDLLRCRNAFCSDQGSKFIQLILPEKTSFLQDKFPRILPPSTLIYAKVKEKVECDTASNLGVIFADDFLSRSDFPKLDTHLYVSGTVQIVKAVLQELELNWPFSDVEMGSSKILWGDLSHRFFPNGRIAEYYQMPKDTFVASLPTPILKSYTEVAGHVGNVRSWHTPDAPFDLSVIAFGNSFFERGGSPRGISWWFARLFKNFSFHWHPEMSHGLIADLKPDLVLCQSIERFLVRVPKT